MIMMWTRFTTHSMWNTNYRRWVYCLRSILSNSRKSSSKTKLSQCCWHFVLRKNLYKIAWQMRRQMRIKEINLNVEIFLQKIRNSRTNKQKGWAPLILKLWCSQRRKSFSFPLILIHVSGQSRNLAWNFHGGPGEEITWAHSQKMWSWNCVLNHRI